MSTKVRWFSGILLVALLISLWAFRDTRAQLGLTLRQALGIETSEVVSVSQVANSNVVLPVETPPVNFKENRAGLDIDSAVRRADAMTLLNQLQSIANLSYYLPGSGWWYEVEVFNADTDLEAQLPDGSPVPDHWRTETWFFVDVHGNVVQSISIQDTGNPRTTQISGMNGNKGVNWTFDEYFDDLESYPAQFNLAINEIESVGSAATLDVKQTVWHDTAVYAFSLTSPMAAGTRGNQIVENALASSKIYYYAVADGRFVGYEIYFIMPDGTILRDSETFVEITKNLATEPPTDILKYLP